MIDWIRKLAWAAWIAAGVVSAGAAHAQAPSAGTQPLRIVMGFPPGGALDTLARLVADELQQDGGQTVLVENRPGAASRIAIDFVKRSVPDGHTVLLCSDAPLVVFPMTYKHLDYDLDRDFVPVAQLAEVPSVISTAADRPYKTLQEYAKWVRANPTQANVGLTSLGGLLHFAVLGMGKSLGLPLKPVPYKGGAPLVTDLVGGHVPLSTDSLASQLALHRADFWRPVVHASGFTSEE